MTTFQQLSTLLSSKEEVQKDFNSLISLSRSKLESRFPSANKLIHFAELLKEALEDARHVSEQGDQEFFDELVGRDLSA